MPASMTCWSSWPGRGDAKFWMGQRFGDQVNCNMMYMNSSADLYDHFETQEITLINNETSTSAAAPCLCFEIINGPAKKIPRLDVRWFYKWHSGSIRDWTWQDKTSHSEAGTGPRITNRKAYSLQRFGCSQVVSQKWSRFKQVEASQFSMFSAWPRAHKTTYGWPYMRTMVCSHHTTHN